MKKVFLAFAVVASALALGSCSSNEPDLSPGDGVISSGTPRYLAVNIQAALDSGTRAEGDETLPDYEDGPLDEEGLSIESKIKSVDFYFFDETGAPAKVKADNSNHMAASPNSTGKPGPEGQDNITLTTEAVLVISTPAGDKIPTQIVAVVNKEAEASYAGLSISDLQKRVTEGINKDGSFVMTNSVYVAGNIEHIGADVAGHLYDDADKAKGDPVKIYVERTLGKVRLKSGIEKFIKLPDGSIAYDPTKAGDKDEIFTTTEGENASPVSKKIYVKFLGWNATATSSLNRLVKLIDPMWNGGWNWYDAYRFRSFWAVNADKNVVLNDGTNPIDGNVMNYFKFEGEDKAADGKTKFDGSDYVYLKENAAVSLVNVKPETASQVIIAAQLVDANGNPIEMAEWAGQRMSVDDLTKALANATTLYKKVESSDSDGNLIHVYTKIEPSDIELVTASEFDPTLEVSNDRRYLVYATLTEAAKENKWYRMALNNDKLNPALNEGEIKTIFASLGGAKVWKEGKTYFYFDIRHLAWDIESAQFGKRGVVRNHVYDSTINSLVGLGTPVYDPEEVIIPEKPEDDDTYIAAEINVLSWRIVRQIYDLNW